MKFGVANLRYILYAGKGGVGKTTISAASATASADCGNETLIISVDPAHSLSDVFDQELGYEPQKIEGDLYGQELDVQHEIKEHWNKLRSYLVDLFRFMDLEGVKASELAIFPGMREVSSLLNLHLLEKNENYDVVIMDLAPTASATRLLSMPDVLAWYMRRIFPFERKAMKVARPILGRAISAPLPEDEVYGESEELFEKLKGVKESLTDPGQTSVRPVLNPDLMAIKETRRIFTHLNVFDFPVDAIIANRVLSRDGGPSDQRLDRQENYMDVIENSFAPLPIFEAEMMEEELVGVDPLRKFGENLWENEDSTSIFHEEKPINITENEEGYVLEISLPFSEKEEIELLERGRELIIKIGQFRRNVFLPEALRGSTPKGAKFDKGKLKINFRGK